MATEPDLSALLPPAPPPRPHAREAAVGAALRRFDGGAPIPRRPARRWRLTGRPQLGALAAAALVAAIGLPLWLSQGFQPQPPVTRPAAIAPVQPAVSTRVVDNLADMAAAAPAPAASRTSASAATMQRADAPAPPAEARRDTLAERAADAPASFAAPAPVAAPPPPPPPPPPAVAVAQEEMAGNDIVVTGSRLDASDEPSRGRLERRKPARDASTSSGVAVTVPKASTAGLDRDLGSVNRDDDKRALADLDRAIKAAPNDAHLRYRRSLILRRLGHIKRADADAARAISLDPRYAKPVD